MSFGENCEPSDSAPDQVSGKKSVEQEKYFQKKEEHRQPTVNMEETTKVQENGIFENFLRAKSRHTISEEAAKDLWNFAVTHSEEISNLKDQNRIQSYITSKRQAIKDLPRISIKIVYKDLRTGDILTEDNLDEFPKSRLMDIKKYKLLYTVTKIDVNELFSKLKHLHDFTKEKIVLSIDGVPETKSGGVTIEVIAFKFKDCKTVFPLCILRPEKKYKISVEDYIGPLLCQLKEASVQISFIVADAPKRSFLRKMKAHSGEQKTFLILI